MIKFTINTEFVTPYFVTGIPNANFRISSFKGILRFWWRATQYHKYNDIEKLHEKEGEIFGSTDHGQSKVIIYTLSRNQPDEPSDSISKHGLKYLDNGLKYLGYGLEGKKPLGDLNIDLQIICPEEFKNEIFTSLKAIAFFGNMGSRARKGFGSLSFNSIKITKENEESEEIKKFEITSFDELKESIKNFLSKFNDQSKPKFSAFSKLTTCYIYQPNEDMAPKELLNMVGEKLQLYRSYGLNGMVGGEPAERNFEFDHDLMKNFSGNASDHPKRVVFGLPHNYYFSSSGNKYEVKPSGSNIKRRASPLFIKIHKIGESAIFVALLLESEFLPEDVKIEISGNNQNSSVPHDVDYSVIRDFFEGVDREYFTGIEKINGDD